MRTTKTLTKTAATLTERMTFLFADAATNAEFGVRVIHEEVRNGYAAGGSDGMLKLATARKWWSDAKRDGFVEVA
jgi:hypothetical protein